MSLTSHLTRKLLLDGRAAPKAYASTLTEVLAYWPASPELSTKDIRVYTTPFVHLPQPVVEDTQYNPVDYSSEELFERVLSKLMDTYPEIYTEAFNVALGRQLLVDPHVAFQWLRGTIKLSITTAELPGKSLRKLVLLSVAPVTHDTSAPLYVSSSLVASSDSHPALTLPDSLMLGELVTNYYHEVDRPSYIVHNIDVSALQLTSQMPFTRMRQIVKAFSNANNEGNATMQLYHGGVPLPSVHIAL